MASLDQFLQDLDDLDDELADGAEEEVQNEEVGEDHATCSGAFKKGA